LFEDKILAWKVRSGSRDALERIYEKYRDDLLRVAAALLDRKDTAEDVVHDVFVKFVKSSANLDLSGSLKAYLLSCVVNRARNANRAGRNEHAGSLDDVFELPANRAGPEEWIILNEEFELLKEAMTILPGEQREAIVLHVYGKLKFKQIARIQQSTTRTCISRYRYGMEKLRSILRGNYETAR
jgi:RNA polymerase sigma-70 factor (ECF subfamily)